MADVVKLAKATGWACYHPFDSRRSTAGFPDLVLVHPKRGIVWFVELKSMYGRLSEAQTDWMLALSQAAGSGRAPLVTVLRPDHWPLAEAMLTGRGTPEAFRHAPAAWEAAMLERRDPSEHAPARGDGGDA